MKQAQILQTLSAGGRIINHILIKPDKNPHRDRISDRQIAALEAKGLVDKRVLYDNTRVWKLKAAPCSNTQAASPNENAS